MALVKNLDIIPARKSNSSNQARARKADKSELRVGKGITSTRKTSKLKFYTLAILSVVFVTTIIIVLSFMSVRLESLLKNFYFIIVLLFINLLILSNLTSITVSLLIDYYEKVVVVYE